MFVNTVGILSKEFGHGMGFLKLITADYKYASIFKFAMLDIKLWLKDDNIVYQFEPLIESV